MPKITTWNRNSDFTLRIKDIQFHIYLKENLLVRHTWQENGRVGEYLKQEAIIEHPIHGLIVWLEKEAHWVQARNEILEAYSNYIAEKEIFKSGDGE